MKTFHALVMMSANAQQMFVAPVFTDDFDAESMAQTILLEEIQQGNEQPAGYAIVTEQSNFFLVDKETGNSQLVDDALLETLQDKEGYELTVQVYPKTKPVDEAIEHIHKLYTNEQVGSNTVH